MSLDVSVDDDADMIACRFSEKHQVKNLIHQHAIAKGIRAKQVSSSSSSSSSSDGDSDVSGLLFPYS